MNEQRNHGEYIYIYVYIYVILMEYHPAIKKKEILPFVTICMNLKDNMLSEVYQTERQKLYDLIYI